MTALIAFFRKNPGILYNLIFSFASWIYGLVLRQDLLSYASINPAIENPPPDYAVGFILLAVIIAETAGMFYKSRDIRYRLSAPDGFKYETPLEGKGFMVLLAVLHITGVMIIGITMFTAFGMTSENGGWLILGALFIRELYLWYLAFLTTSDRNKDYASVSGVKKILANICLMLWGLVAYTIVWERFAIHFTSYFRRGDLFSSPGSVVQFVFVIIGVALASLLLFLPTRFGFILEESTFLKDSREKMYFKISICIAIASAILPYVL